MKDKLGPRLCPELQKCKGFPARWGNRDGSAHSRGRGNRSCRGRSSRGKEYRRPVAAKGGGDGKG